MNVLIACEESQRVCIEFRKRGHRAFSCDISEPSGGHPEWHIQGDALPLLNGDCSFNTKDGKIHTVSGKWDLLSYDWVEDICRIIESPNEFSDERMWDCPLAEIPTPHGRLIDADDLDCVIREIKPIRKGAVCEALFNASTIIEAEEG